MAWKKGPLPPDTYQWGGVVPVGPDIGGFYFADFRGDTAIASPGTPQERTLRPEEVAWYDNSLGLPPDSPKGAGRATGGRA